MVGVEWEGLGFLASGRSDSSSRVGPAIKSTIKVQRNLSIVATKVLAFIEGCPYLRVFFQTLLH